MPLGFISLSVGALFRTLKNKQWTENYRPEPFDDSA